MGMNEVPQPVSSGPYEALPRIPDGQLLNPELPRQHEYLVVTG